MMIQAIIASAMMLQGAPADGQVQVQPVAMIESQQDPAALINLGVELAQAGETEAARKAFEKVIQMRVAYTLQTTDGRFVHPSDLARQGLQMLDSGAFAAKPDQIAAR
ncbi:tetratricopeptide repeat protein [Citromicrobium bathyomarinum]|uniref:tetratricopeptide repeat protein n=1 Tax=Citromicrobium bathyomarinum TaxID=72174 RepID=UPI003159E357